MILGHHAIFVWHLLLLAISFYIKWTHVCAQSCPTLCNLMNRSPPGSSLHGIPDKNTGVGCHLLFQGTFPTQGSNMCLLYQQMDSLPLSCHGSPRGEGPTYTVHGKIHWHSHYKEQSLKAKKTKNEESSAQDVTFLHLGLYPKNTILEKDTLTPTFMTALLTTANTQNQQNAHHPIQAQRRRGVCIQWTTTQPQRNT